MRAVVIGSGVAGLGISELLVRNGWHVTLMERKPDLGGDASRRTQDWWHTGWLYAGLPDSSAMEGCAKAARIQQTMYGDDTVASWAIAQEMLYAYACNTSDLPRGANAAWRSWVTVGPLRRMKRAGFAGEEIEAPEALAELMRRWEDCDDGPSRYRTIRSTDKGIDTAKVLRWLAGHLGDADVVTDADIRLTQMRGQTIVRVNGLAYRADLVVVAAGAGIRTLLEPINPSVATSFTSVMSPIAVLRAKPWPAFIRYTANLDRTVNHMPYPTPSGMVSTIGSHDEMKVGDDPSSFLDKIGRMLPLDNEDADSVGVYLGTKTEYTRGRGRRYNHAVVQVNANTVAVVPGKFSQFPLLVSEFAAGVPGLRLDGRSLQGGRPELVGSTEPERLARLMDVPVLAKGV